MKRVIFLMSILALFVSACSGENTESKESETNVVYQCPMRCEGDKVYDKPGQCPVCNMDLKEVEMDHHHEDGHDH